MSTAYKILLEAQALGIKITAHGEQLRIEAPIGKMTVELKQALKAHKTDILYLLTLPEPAQPGEEVKQLRHEIGEMVRAQARRMKMTS